MYVQNQLPSILSNAYGNAAQMTANAGMIRGQGQAQMGRDIGGVIQQLGGMAGKNKEDTAKAKLMENMLRKDPESYSMSEEMLDNMSRRDFLNYYKHLPVQLQAGQVKMQEQVLAQRQEEQQLTAELTARMDEALAMSRNPGPVRPEILERARALANSPAGRLREAGLPVTPQLLMSMAQAQEQGQFMPEVLELDNGVRAMTTSRGSAIPLRGNEAGAPPEQALGDGPAVSKDGIFYDSSSPWRPKPQPRAADGGVQYEVLQQERAQLLTKMAEMQVEARRASTNRMMPGKSRQWYEKEIAKKMKELEVVDAQLRALGGAPAAAQGPAMTPAAAGAAPPQAFSADDIIEEFSFDLP